MVEYKNTTTQTLSVVTKGGKTMSIKAGAVEKIDLKDNPRNNSYLHSAALQEVGADKKDKMAAPTGKATS